MHSRRVTADLLHRFTPPPGLSRSAPRDVQLTRGGRALTAVALLLIALAVGGGTFLYHAASSDAKEIAAIEQRGITTTATIDRVWRKNDDGKPAFASFHFDAAGTRIGGETRMNVDAWRKLRAGSVVRVRYLEEDPARSLLDGERIDPMPMGVSFVVAGVLASLALGCGLAINHQRALLMEGRVAPAVVTEVKKQHSSHESGQREMRYEFPLLGGGVAVGKASAPKTAAVGTMIVILYDPDRPKRNHPYPFSLVTPNVN